MAQGIMDERKRRILKVITDDYIASAEPVGSRTIARKYDLGLSPATIRNEMADLEEEGYLEQPHTSAGRIPSHRGYRYYVNELMERRRLQPEEIERIVKGMSARKRAIDHLIHQAARVLAQFTHYPSLILAPDKQHAVIKHVRLVRLGERSVLLLFVTNTGQVESKVIDCYPDLNDFDLDNLSGLLNMRLCNRPVVEIKTTMEKELGPELRCPPELFRRTLEALLEAVRNDTIEQVITDGTAQILDQPEFAERERFRPLLDLFEEEQALYRLLTENAGPGKVRVTIGEENKEEAVRNCSVVTATYEAGPRAVGIIGVLGPTRMDYAKVLATVEFMASHLSRLLGELTGN
ncbi:MAG: heat-inducible transcription repressor HrcA [Firmicutes bacterium]|nr:heat-inducible transcription repressor HrcA [Bacillota bacterium]